MALPGSSQVQRFSMLLLLVCLGALLVITACGFVPPNTPYSQPDTFLLREDSAAGHVLGHGSLRVSGVQARIEVVLYGQPGDQVSTVDLKGLIALTFPRRLLLHGTSGQASVSLRAESPNPFVGDGFSGLLPFTGGLKFDDGPISRQTRFRAETYSEERFLLQLPATGNKAQTTNFSLNLTLWPGDRPETRHIAAELSTSSLCSDAARSNESVSTAIDQPFVLDLGTTHGGTVRLQFAQPLTEVRARADVLRGSVSFTGGPCNGQQYTLDGTRF